MSEAGNSELEWMVLKPHIFACPHSSNTVKAETHTSCRPGAEDKFLFCWLHNHTA